MSQNPIDFVLHADNLNSKYCSMTQLTYIKKNKLEWWDIKEPKLESAQDVIVRPLAAARCDGDKAFLFYDITPMLQAGMAIHYLDTVTRNMFGRKPFKAPFAIGHECVAEILSCGDEVRHFKVGDKVIVPWAISCGSCSHCLSGLTSKCADAGETLFSSFGFGEPMGPWGGMVTDKFKVPRVKLAYLIAIMASPLTILTPISSWIGMIIGQLDSVGISLEHKNSILIQTDPFFVYLKSIPFIFYPIIIISSTIFLVRKKISFGPMHTQEKIANETGNLFGGKEPLEIKIKSSNYGNESIWDLTLPILSLISTILIGMAYTGGYYLFGGTYSFIESLVVLK